MGVQQIFEKQMNIADEHQNYNDESGETNSVSV